MAVHPLAFYSSMHLAGVAVGTVVSTGTAALASALIERVVGRRPPHAPLDARSRPLPLGTALLCVAEAAPATDGTGPQLHHPTLLGISPGLVAAATYAFYSWAAHRLVPRQIPSPPPGPTPPSAPTWRSSHVRSLTPST